jgi:hypothetical protein
MNQGPRWGLLMEKPEVKTLLDFPFRRRKLYEFQTLMKDIAPAYSSSCWKKGILWYELE